MASPSKEDDVLKLLLENSPLKEWHFEEVVKEAKVTRLVANKWLKKYLDEGLIVRIKKKGKFPFFTVGSNNPVYYSFKRIYALKKLHSSGLMAALLAAKEAKAVILFGSMAKGDWYKDSDIDIFILGKAPNINKNLYEQRLRRSIEMHVFRNKKEIKQVKTGLIANVVNGYVLKGKVQDIAEVA